MNAIVAPDAAASDCADCFAGTNINPETGLATDYLNHFNEAVMLLDLLSEMQPCMDDFLAWQPRSYRAHFAASRLRERDLAVRAYEGADPQIRARFDALVASLDAILMRVRDRLAAERDLRTAGRIARRASAMLKPLINRAAHLINGTAGDGDDAPMPQQAIDRLLAPSTEPS